MIQEIYDKFDRFIMEFNKEPNTLLMTKNGLKSLDIEMDNWAMTNSPKAGCVYMGMTIVEVVANPTKPMAVGLFI